MPDKDLDKRLDEDTDEDLDMEAFFSVNENDARPIVVDETLTPEEREKKRQEAWKEALRFAEEMERKYGK